MFKAFCNWIREKLGEHVCREFTQWETEVRHYSRPTTAYYDVGIAQKTIETSRRYQTRRCTICGLEQQIKLDL